MQPRAPVSFLSFLGPEHEDPHKILFGSLLEAIVATDAICNYITESQKNG